MNNAAIDLDEYRAITAQIPQADVSEKYGFIPTTRIITVLEKQGWYPVQASEVNTRNELMKGFQKHLLRFRNDSLMQLDDQNIAEIVLINSHNRMSSFCIMAGIFRMVCSNGLIIADSTFQSHKIRHIGYTDGAVVQAITDVCDNTPKIAGRIKEFQEIELTPDERGIFASAALVAKYGEEVAQDREFVADSLISPKRHADQAPTLWNTFNVVQEKFIQGGSYELKQRKNRYSKYHAKNRGTKAISENVRINQALWMLTEKMATLKSN